MIRTGDPTATNYADIIGYGKARNDTPAAEKKNAAKDSGRSEREINDTIELSDGAKQVNLARGFDLAEAVRNEKDPEKVYELIKSGTEDINRIGRLFTEVAKDIRALFGFSRT